MTRIIAILISLISINSANAQWAENNAIYLSGELHFGNFAGADFNLNYVYKENYTFKVGISGYRREPKSQPDDYSPGLIGFISYGLLEPHDQLENFQITVGKIYKLNESGTIRANIALGVGYTTIIEPENWIRNDDIFFGPNYNWENHKYNAISLIINPKIEFPFTRFFGLTASPILQLNKENTYFGIGVGTMIGLLRNKRT